MQKVADPGRYFSKRVGETRLGETLHWFTHGEYRDFLKQASDAGCQVVLLGIPESIGPVANHGFGGAENGWDSFLNAFANIQHNSYLPGGKVAVVGTPDLSQVLKAYSRLEKHDLESARKLVVEVDKMVFDALLPVFECGMVPVVIGGGHNNAYPLIKAAATARNSGIQVINCDPHADFRILEGRHSGNGFSYAMEEGYLNRYLVIGLHQSYNSEEMLTRMEENQNVHFTFFDEEPIPAYSLQQAASFLDDSVPCGIELDTDAIAGFPASAKTPLGISLKEAIAYLKSACELFTPAYIHLPEAAPPPAESKYTGKALSYMVTTTIKSILSKKTASN
ncbi:formimidoylglutamase [Roseivirga sp. BDSF3-8]|uniref:formimidoylglutamase n=1 Tax=Roseivirga sp. BDSF3-8 TaxID=3241598 RepID=UPI0035321EC8